MKLADLRKLAIRKQVRIHFRLRNGLECVVNEKGVAQVPALKAPPDFSLEEELSAAGSFDIEPVALAAGRNASPTTQIPRAELAAMTRDGAGAAAADEHEDE